MSTLNVTLTDKQRQSIEELARRENLSPEECASMMLTEKLTEVDELQYLKLRASRGSRDAFLKLLKKAPDAPPIAGDENIS